jgi:hypothetical protein
MKRHLLSKFNFGLILTLIVSLSLNAFGYINNNQTGKGYEEGSGGNSIVERASIEDYIVVGGGYYLKANSSVQELLEVIELQDVEEINWDNVRMTVDNAIENMNNAIETYDALIARAEAAPYYLNVITQLKNFEYDDYRLLHGLNRTIFDKVEDYLRKGNITGLFKHTNTGFNKILTLLTSVKGDIDQNRIPDLSLFWQLNESLSETSMFGSYVARVFHSIK